MVSFKKLSAIAVSAAILTLGATPAKAITLSVGGTQVSGNGYVSGVSGASTIDFNSGAAPTSGIAVYSAPNSTPTIVQGSQVNQYATPAGDTTKYLTVAQTGSNVTGATGSVAINFTKALDYFGLYWGSVDTYNFIDFFSGGKLLKTFGGADVSKTATGSWTGVTDNIYTNFFADKGESFDKVVLRSDGIAFESDNHAYRSAAQSVPEPSSMAGLLAVGILGAGSLLKRRGEQKA